MSRHVKTVVDPQALERIRTVRAAEDCAIAQVFRHAALVEAAQRRRTESLLTLDAEVRQAEDKLADARVDLVKAAGAQRAAAMLGLTPAALRRLLPGGGRRNESLSLHRVTLSEQDGE